MVLLAIFTLLVIVLLANVGLDEDWARSSTRFLILAVNGSIVLFSIIILFSASQPLPEALLAQDSQLAQSFQRVGLQVGMVGIITAIAASLVWLRPARLALGRGMGALHFGNFDPASPVHITALVLTFYLMASMMVQWLLAGGIGGLADISGPIGLTEVLLSGMLASSFALMGVGLGVRRNWPQTWQRLGMAAPSWRNVGAGFATAMGLLFLVVIVTGVWFALAPQAFDEVNDASQVLFGGFASIRLAIIVAVSTAIGEEMLFRGALQPRLGLIPTTMLFAIMHVQYTLSPAAVIIFGVGLGFGLLRKWQDTTAAMVAHFFYNFALLAIASSAS